ncbi:TolC family protein [Aequorivita sp. 609]|uniref:TolC family protein n=1 Tax=Aequorivita TaxID=153265 RepID=UPI001618889C|nr:MULTISPECIES: TolC family protein [Aequorivita]MBB6682472.1 TolC family protein [Aequorivita sp. 609]
MKRIILFCVSIALGLQLQAQETLKISREEAETMFLQNNLLLISEKLNIESQKAEVIQAKLWPNPEFSISEINLWRAREVEPSPPFFGNFGRNQQIAFELNQLVQTAGKRKKLIALEQVDVSKAEQYFEDLLRGLKLELRNQLTDLQHTQQSIKVHQNLIDHISILTNAYKNQLEKGNISKAEYIRLKAQELEINKEILELTRESNEIQKELKLLLRTNPTVSIEITDDGFVKNTNPYEAIFIDQIVENAKENRPDYKLALLEEEYSNKLLSYEKAQRIPDMTFGVNYDRNGNTMLDFVGFGVSFDLPVFNRNKGGIKKAQISIESAKIQKEQTVLTIENEILLAYISIQQAVDFVNNIEPDFEKNLDLLLENYTKNLISKNASMLEYIDFINAYLGNKKIILEAQKEVNKKAEELNYFLGKDFNN